MTAIARGSVTEPHELGRFIDDERRPAGGSSATPRRGLYRPTLPRRAAFWLLAAVLCLSFVATGAPAPLYGVYQAEWHFSVTTLTAVFAYTRSSCWSRSSQTDRCRTMSGAGERSSVASRRMDWRAACSCWQET